MIDGVELGNGSRSGAGAALSIRPYRDADREWVIALWRRCGLLVWYNDPQRDIALWQETPTAEIFVGETDRGVAATCCVGSDGHRGWLYYVAVDPELRQRGYGRQIVRHAEAWLSERRVPKVELLIRSANRQARGFYENLGYEPNTSAIMQRWLRDLGPTPSAESGNGDAIAITVTYLEMTERPSLPYVHPPAGRKLALLRAQRPTVAFYRFLYETVGAQWLWYERRAMADAALRAVIEDERVEIYVLYVDGVPAGYSELDRREPPDIELAYFGLMPNYIGLGLGRYLLTWTIDTAWSHEPARLWVHTNTLDHAKALPLYQRCGFRPYRQDHKQIVDPRLLGLF